jgi:hypothetical protein
MTPSNLESVGRVEPAMSGGENLESVGRVKPGMSGRENLESVGRLFGLDRREARSAATRQNGRPQLGTAGRRPAATTSRSRAGGGGTSREGRSMTTQRLPRIVGWVGVVFALGSGVWAFLAPRSFYDNIATFEPYNRHFLHDIGAFTIGLGAAMLLALVTRWDALRVALAGLAVASVVHVLSHGIDADLGGRDTDLPGLTAVALLFVVATALARPGRVAQGERSQPDPPLPRANDVRGSEDRSRHRLDPSTTPRP